MKFRRTRIWASICVVAYYMKASAWNPKFVIETVLNTDLQPLQTVFQPPHALLAERGADTPRFKEDRLPSTTLRHLLVFLCISMLCQSGRRWKGWSFRL